MQLQNNVPLAQFTSLNVGGTAQELATPATTGELITAASATTSPWVLGYGTNSLISDAGLPGRTLRIVNGTIEYVDNLLIADAGVWWDEVVKEAISRNLWGLELMSAIPGGVGGAVVGNIAAYGQAISDTLVWIDVYDTKQQKQMRIEAHELDLTYRHSNLQHDDRRHLVILRAAFELSSQPKKDVSYQRVTDIAERDNHDLSTLDGRRQAVLQAREEAGSLWDYRDKHHSSHNAGSFFRNPLISPEQVDAIIAHDESGTTADQIRKMNQTHGGSSTRVSAAHVMLAAGFSRGQSWGTVRLHPSHVLKLETLPGATATDVYAVVQEIEQTVREKLSIELMPEPRLFGEF